MVALTVITRDSITRFEPIWYSRAPDAQRVRRVGMTSEPKIAYSDYGTRRMVYHGVTVAESVTVDDRTFGVAPGRVDVSPDTFTEIATFAINRNMLKLKALQEAMAQAIHEIGPATTFLRSQLTPVKGAVARRSPVAPVTTPRGTAIDINSVVGEEAVRAAVADFNQRVRRDRA